MSKRREAQRFWRELRQEGFSVQVTRGSHTRIDHPNLPGPIWAPSTPSDWRALLNVRATIRRHMKGPPP